MLSITIIYQVIYVILIPTHRFGHVTGQTAGLSVPLFRDAVELLEADFTKNWIYKDLYNKAEQLGVTPELLDKSLANLGNEKRLRKIFVKALEGDDIDFVIVGGSNSRGAPFSEKKGLGYRIYYHAVAEWWNHVFAGLSGSKLEAKSVAIGGIGSDYYSYCLTSHLPEDTKPTVFLWELASNDRKRFDDKQYPRAQPLEQLSRNILSRPSKPALMYANFFRGIDYNIFAENKCRNFEDEGGQKIAEYYMVTSVSWRSFVCDGLSRDDAGFRYREFAQDNFHPNIRSHAQMAYLIINYMRSVFLRMLKLPGIQTMSLSVFKEKVWSEGDTKLPTVYYHETSNEKPLCLTYFFIDDKQPNNTLTVAELLNKDDFRYNTYKKFKLRGDQLGGLQTFVAEQLLTYSIIIERPVHRLVIVTHGGTGAAKVWVDDHTPVIVNTMNYHMGTKLEIVATNLKEGKHTLNILSLDGGFALSGIAVI